MKGIKNIKPKRQYLPAILWISLILTSGAALQSQTPQQNKDVLVSTEWLAQNLSDSLLVLLHWGMKTGYNEEHIPGAIFASVWDILVEDDQGLRNELPDPDSLELVLRSWGINNNSRIVICYQDVNAISRAARLFYTLDYAGLGSQVSVLNGGFKAWKLEGRALSNEVLPYDEGNVDIRIREDVRISREGVFGSLDKEGVVLIDARPPEKYHGYEEDQSLEREGHIPGAVNIPYFEVTGDSEDLRFRFKDSDELNALFSKHNIHEGDTLLTYCGTGIWASSLYLTARFLGYRVQLYDGSFQEWGNDESLPVVGHD